MQGKIEENLIQFCIHLCFKICQIYMTKSIEIIRNHNWELEFRIFAQSYLCNVSGVCQ